jgi:hypothetical protein
LKLEGKLIGPWVPEFERYMGRQQISGPAVNLDLEDLSFIDEPGRSLLRRMEQRGVHLLNCPEFIRHLLTSSEIRHQARCKKTTNEEKEHASTLQSGNY